MDQNLNLTPEQEQKRIKNQAKRERQKLAKASNASPVQANNTRGQNQKNESRPRMTDEEYTKNLLDKKSAKLERDPKSSVVSTAETSESKALAYQIDEINTITDYTRSNMGTAKLSIDDGAKLIRMFQSDIVASIHEFIKLAHSMGIGSRYSLKEHQENQRKQNAKDERVAKDRELSITREIAAETKERENQEKAVKTALTELEKAQEALTKTQETVEKTMMEQASGYDVRIISQRERFTQEKAQAAIANQTKETKNEDEAEQKAS